jgi:hypothetical protein
MEKAIVVFLAISGAFAADKIVAPTCEEPVVTGYKPILDKCELRANPIPMGKLT